MTENDIYRIFDEGGTLSKGFPQYEYREGQLKMALQVREAFENHAILSVEAGTGIGKSFAYLVPALYNAMEHPDERTVIATSTINLQRQLYDKDIPMLFRLLDRSCPVAMAVGRNNYVCIRRFMEQRNDVPLLVNDPSSEIGKFSEWLSTTETGLLGEVPFRLSDELRGEVNSDADLCQGWNCPHHSKCFFAKAKQKEKEAKIIIGNHHLLFSDAQSRYENQTDYTEDGVLPAFNRLIIDEAHNIEANATEYFTAEYDPAQMKRQLAIIERRRGSSSLLEKLAPYGDQELVDRIHDDILLLNGQVDTLDQYLVTLFAKTDFQPCLIKKEHQGKLVEFVRMASDVAATSGRLASKIEKFLEGNKASDDFKSNINELSVRGKRIQTMSSVLSDFCNFPLWTDDIHWFDTETNRKKTKRILVKITPLSIAHVLVDAIFKKLDTVVCTSATLSLGDDFAFWGSRVGLPYDDERPFLRGVYPSPFDFKRRLLLLTPSDAPEYKKDNPEPYIAYIAKTVWESTLSAGGGTLVLFTSYKMLKEVRQRLQEQFDKNHMTLYGQGDMDRFSLLKTFIQESDSSLFATSSFWEGVDAPGQTLRMVIIVKLPFQVPSDPVFKARCDALDAQGGSSFMQLGLPTTTMKLKQGFGRLLRNKEDRGVVMILDSRIIRKNYGMAMLRALPESFHPEVLSGNISERVENFLYGA
jgi:ATP-dependent DNA helicase DinG